MTRYRTALGWRIFMWIGLPPLLALSVWVGVIAVAQDEFNWVSAAILLPVSIGLTGLCLYGFADLIVSYYAVDDQRVIYRSPFRTRTLLLSEIKGFRQDKNYTHLVPKDPAKKTIGISTYVGKHGELVAWLAERFDDLDLIEVVREAEEILANEEYGTTQVAREAKLVEARRWAKYVNIVGWGTLIWAWFYPYPYTVCLVVNLIVPFLALLVAYLFRGLIRLDERANSAYPGVTTGLIMPGAGLAIRAIFDYNILEYGGIWKYVAMLAVTMSVLFYLVGSEFDLRETRHKVTVAAFTILIAAYSYGALLLVNCRFDQSEPLAVEATILDKEISSGKSTTYYLKLGPWGSRQEPENVSVAESEYNAAEVGDVVTVYLHSGLIGTPWFWIGLD